MQEKTDAQLLRDYAEHRNEAAFCELVRRHADVVYASALRQVGSPDLAQDIAQSVFTDLARKAQPLAGTLTEETSLLGWLFRSTRFLALNQLRDDRRRQARERHAMQHFDPASETAPEWERVQPVLDEAMADLSDKDRDALLLRFFKNRDFRAIGAALGVSDDAAQKRVSRALERLRTQLTSRGVTTSAVALSTVLSTNAVPLAPAGLAATLSSAALAGTTLTTTATAAAKTIAMTTLQKTVITAFLAAAVGTGIYEARQVSNTQKQVQALLQQQASAAEQIEQLRRERDEATNGLAVLRDENERLNRNTQELLRLRAQVSELRSREKDLVRLIERTTTPPKASEANAVHFDRPFLKKATSRNVGLDTVDNALQTYLWALSTGDANVLAEISTKDENGNPRRIDRIEGLPLDVEQNLVGLQPLSADVGSIGQDVTFPKSPDDVTSIHFALLAQLSKPTDDGGHEGYTLPLTFRFKKEGQMWKFDGCLRAGE